ncbi:MAG: gliding motility protein GldB [Prevotella sp.]|nr:gliding motility protein GldB [Prevotella sp.]
MVLLCTACEFKLKPNDDDNNAESMKVERYDRLQSRYLITGDFSALQQMNTEYPIETRTLVEKMLQIGQVSDHDINEKFLHFYQDSTLQTLINDAESEYANMDDINEALEKSFGNLKKWLPDMPLPHVYTQIGAFDQSIVVGGKMIGISLDKYMGAKYPLYKRYGYSNEQLESMGRNNIVPDCLTFYLLSLYPMDNYDSRSQLEKDLHMGKVMWVVNKALEQHFFDTDYVSIVGRYMRHHSGVTVAQLLQSDDYSMFK